MVVLLAPVWLAGLRLGGHRVPQTLPLPVIEHSGGEGDRAEVVVRPAASSNATLVKRTRPGVGYAPSRRARKRLAPQTRKRMKLETLAGLALAAALVAPLAPASGDAATAAETRSPRRLAVDDYLRLGDVTDPRMSPDGRWISYTVTRQDLDKDKRITRGWMVPATGGDAVPLTAEDQSSTHLRWSPDGKYLAFLSARDKGKKKQVWTLFREGGEAVQITATAQDVSAFEWSPDGARMVVVLQDPTPAELEAKEQGDQYKEKPAPAVVVTRRQFKRDYVGYLDSRRTHLFLLDTASKKLEQITAGDFDDAEPAWSPDGTRIAFTSNRTSDPDSNYNTDIWVVDASPGAGGGEARALQRITSNFGPDTAPAWSPDGKLIAHTSVTDVAAMLYATAHLAVSSADGTGSRVLTAGLDRWVFEPRFSTGGDGVLFMVEDGGEQNLARIPAGGGAIERLIRGRETVLGFDPGPGGAIAILASTPQLPPEVFVLSAGRLEQRSFTNRDLLAEIGLSEVEEVRFGSSDGTEIEGFVTKPPGFTAGRRYPTILDIHGGPQAQFDYRFDFKGQLLAGAGYLVVQPNPRGSNGYGQDFCLAIWQDWGGPDYEDVMAAVDDVIDRGWADPDRLGVTGWSYGGMLTNHVITKTRRFKAAATGASAALYVVNYGHDMYQRWWEMELGLPWKPEARELWDRLSPFNRIENVTTPTLILGGAIDWNVPIINSEQLYLALRRLGVETELVVYPDEYHHIDTPSRARDLYQRYLGWFGKYLHESEEPTR
jgi:dipeptidyl aminopeptidase/acylaminoacyl peptidase